jgi:endonuclease/exonuclease/phosphatase family metal-dependent hydrolase
MTYNVRRCIGLDGQHSPSRIAEVIAAYAPDIVALQELDVGRAQTLGLDQPQVIAEQLEMKFHFHPCMHVEEGSYGHAILSHYPIRIVRAAALPRPPHLPRLEPRGALWAEIRMRPSLDGEQPVQVVSTHLGLRRLEHYLQARALLGHDWLRRPDCRPPVILCGDFNATPGSATYDRLTSELYDAQRWRHDARPIGTWPTVFPVLRIDHVFVSADVQVEDACVPSTPLTRIASDHLPVLVTAALP